MVGFGHADTVGKRVAAPAASGLPARAPERLGGWRSRWSRSVLLVTCVLTALVAGAAPAGAEEPSPAGAGVGALDARLTGPYAIQNRNSGQYMAVQGASRANNALVVQWDTIGSASNDIMFLEYEGDSNWVRIKPFHTWSGTGGSPHNDKCLAVQGASRATGASVVQHTCSYDRTDNDVWYDEPVPHGRQFRNRHSGLCLVVKGASRVRGERLIQAPCNGSTNGHWTT